MRDVAKIILPIVFFFFVFTEKGESQGIITPQEESVSNQVFLTIGLEPEMVSTIGYMHIIGKVKENLNFHLGASVKFAPLILSNRAARFNIISNMDWYMNEKWGTRITNNLYLAHDHNLEGIMNGLGVELRSSTVHYGKNWHSGFEIGWQYAVATHLKHSAKVKETFQNRYPDDKIGISGPKDGWYKDAVSRFRLGFVTSNTLSEHLTAQLGVGGLIFIQKQGVVLGFSHAQVPLYLEGMLGYKW